MFLIRLPKVYTVHVIESALKLMKAITRGCRTNGGKSIIILQILNGASQLKFNQGEKSVFKKESANAITMRYFIAWKI